MDRETPRKQMNDDRRKVSTSKRDKGAQQDKVSGKREQQMHGRGLDGHTEDCMGLNWKRKR